jgi:hypothetical protein
MEKYLNGKGRNIIGWDEILEGGLAPNATVLSWRGVEGGLNAAKEEMGIWAYPMILVIYAIAAALFSRKQKLAPKIKKTLQRAGS